MPCINNTNGQSVPGAAGSCPIGSTWVDDTSSSGNYKISKEDLANMHDEWEGGGLQNIGDWFTPGGAIKAVAGTAVAAPFIKGGINYVKKKATDPKNLKKLENLKNKLFKRWDQPVRPKYPLMNKNAQRNWNAANPGKWLFDKWKLGAWGGGSALTLQNLMSQMSGDDGATEEKPKKFMSTAEQYQQTAGQQAPAPEPTAMEQFGKNIKDPKWWMESMSGDKTDTRLMRLGQLMDYYGRTPKQRAAVDMPSKVWAANAASAAKGSASSYTALKNMILKPRELADAIYIDKGGMMITGWGKMDADLRKAEAQKMGNAINSLMHELAMAGQLPTWENAAALYYARNPDKDPRNKSTKPDEDEEASWRDYFS
jgi:roadblock/LC7 domain-containing protein